MFHVGPAAKPFGDGNKASQGGPRLSKLLGTMPARYRVRAQERTSVGSSGETAEPSSHSVGYCSSAPADH